MVDPERVPPKEVAARVDSYMGGFRAQRKWVVKVALVGYTPDRFIVRNSWGTGWGDKGFGYASLAYAQDAFTEAYGVSP